ncbi:hypothetical protein M3Y97_00183600 [Aphelenchoides bicaudatus]|nr:hypothetical protein M3Y97_00183600 [Aphelenchoides bicaudatus]
MEQESVDTEALLEQVDPEEEVDQKAQNSFELRNRIDELEFDNVELQYQLHNHQSLANGCLILDSEYQALKDSADKMALELQSKTEQIELLGLAIGDVGKFYASLQTKSRQVTRTRQLPQINHLFETRHRFGKSNKQPSKYSGLAELLDRKNVL